MHTAAGAASILFGLILLQCAPMSGAALETFATVALSTSNDRVTLCDAATGLSAVQAADACVCGPGFGGADDASCTACGLGTHKKNSEFVGCTNCGSNRLTLAGARDSAECVCAEGFEESSGSCAGCAAGFYKAHVGNDACLPCFEHGTSAAGSTAVSACVCVAGYTAAASSSTFDGTCEACGTGHFKSSIGMEACTQCRANSETSGAATDASECLCAAGYYEVGGVCTVCPAGHYKTSVGNEECTPCGGFAAGLETTVSTGSEAESACVCAVGAGIEGGVCAQCPVNTQQNTEADVPCVDCSNTQYAAVGSSVCSPCPGNSLREGTTGVIGDCYCTEGYYEASNECNQCEAGTFKTSTANEACESCAAGKYEDQPGSTGCEECHLYSYSEVGSTSVAECLCNAGYHPNAGACVACLDGYVKAAAGNTPCVACAAGSYSSNTFSCSSCQDHSTTDDVASTSIADCKCVAGFQETADDVDLCESCSVGFYCPGQDNREQCHDHSTSEAGSSAASACVCNAGYWPSSTANCANCPVGSFCFGDAKYACPAPGSSLPNSHNEAACTCNPGYEGVPVGNTMQSTGKY